MDPTDVYLSYVGLFFFIGIALVVRAAGKYGRLKAKMDASLAGIDRLLDGRFHLLQAFEKTSCKYVAEGEAAIAASREFRSRAVHMQTVEERARFEKGLNRIAGGFLALAENNALLKADAGFMKLSEDSRSLEEQTETAREEYNEIVQAYRKLRASVVSGIVGEIMSYPEGEEFPASGED